MKSAVCPRPTVKRGASGVGSNVRPISAPSMTRRKSRGGDEGEGAPRTVASSAGGDGGRGGATTTGLSFFGGDADGGEEVLSGRSGGGGLISGGAGAGGGDDGRCRASGSGNSIRRRLLPKRISSWLLSGCVVIRPSWSLRKVPLTLPRSARTTLPFS